MKTLTKLSLLLVVFALASVLFSSCSAGYPVRYHSHKFTGTAREF